jgi:hypothetical protein
MEELKIYCAVDFLEIGTDLLSVLVLHKLS